MGKSPEVRVALWNVRSLGDPKKSTRIASHLKSLNPNLILLTETWKPAAVASAFARRLGTFWKCVSTDTPSGSRGCAVLWDSRVLSANSPPTINPDGWFVSVPLTAIASNLPLRCTSVYTKSGAHPLRATHLDWLSSAIPHDPSHIIGGDWNAVEVPSRDKPDSPPSSPLLSNAMSAAAAKLGVIEPADEHTLTSTTCVHSSVRLRYDRFYVSPSLLPFFSPPRVPSHPDLSDHFPVVASLDQSSASSPPAISRWVMDRRLFKSRPYLTKIRHILESSPASDIPSLVSLLNDVVEATKPAQKRLRRRLAKKRSELEEKAHAASTQFNLSPSPELLSISQAAHAAWEEERLAQESELRAKAAISWDEGHELPSSFLSNVANFSPSSQFIDSLSTLDPNTPIPRHQCAQYIHEEFAKVYSCRQIYLPSRKYFDLIPLPTLPSDVSHLNSPPSLSEIKAAIAAAPNKRAPGPDGIVTEFWKVFSDQAAPILERCYAAFWARGPECTEFGSGLMALVPKKVPKITSFSHIRPISLLNTSYKIFSAILAARIKPYMSSLVHPSQTGYIPGRLIWDSVLTVDLCEHVSPTPLIKFLIDFYKAFDSMDHGFIDYALTRFGFPLSFRSAISFLCHRATCTIIFNGEVHHCSFPILGGTRQGDPVSGFLFVLALELLLAAVRHEPSIKGIHLSNNNEAKSSAYVDDVTFLLADPTSYYNTRSLLSLFQQASGMAINPKKCTISAPPNTLPPDDIPPLSPEGERLLGFTLTPDGISPSCLSSINKLSTSLSNLSHLYLSLPGKSNCVGAYATSLLSYLWYIITPPSK